MRPTKPHTGPNLITIAGLDVGSIQERNERMEAIKARVARRHRNDRRAAAGTERVYGRGLRYTLKKGGVAHARYTRCQLPRRPETLAEMRSIHAQPPCGALCFAGEENEHLAEVHGLVGDTVDPWPFEPVEERRDTEEPRERRGG